MESRPPDTPEDEDAADRAPYHVGVNPRVEFFLDRYTGVHRSVVALWLSRATRYLRMIREVLEAHGLPEELAFMALVESGYNPLAVSPAGAKGLWQFMPDTARRYGLRVDRWVDERFDPEKSTVAAASYLRDLHSRFGSWALALAAYNAGEGRVAAAIRRTRSTDFWVLARSRFLRRETKNFVPQIHAAAVIGRDPTRYGFEIPEASAPETETVEVPPLTSLAGLSRAAGLSLETLRRLNRGLVRGVTPPGSPYEVRVPAGARDRILAALARPVRVAGRGGRLTGAARVGDIHIVRPRETVTSIARRYGVTVDDVLRWNRIKRPERIRPGDLLRVADFRLTVDRSASARTR